ncbi:uncharacterized protein DSM5745_03946 [Aspergillus mulundensis]|uniref:Uncharacterized protein n=1 Tax=Aspergillus mulundensis TaxID=1810919 RepID=A0A3D8SBD1_9EURO|nr:hypothetical protein DSM5745_03946 [Aspergillus mulundensis]RDW83620.1 hypothetical protein DSM5745_03946 [Aspergillus mulundensis]
MGIPLHVPNRNSVSYKVEHLIQEVKDRFTDNSNPCVLTLGFSIEYLMKSTVSMMSSGPNSVPTIYIAASVYKDFERFYKWLHAAGLNTTRRVNRRSVPYHLSPLASLEPAELSTNFRAADAAAVVVGLRWQMQNGHPPATQLVELGDKGMAEIRAEMWKLQRQMFKVVDVMIRLAQGAENGKGQEYMERICPSYLGPALGNANTTIHNLWVCAEQAGLSEDSVQGLDVLSIPETDAESEGESESDEDDGAQVQAGVDEDGDYEVEEDSDDGGYQAFQHAIPNYIAEFAGHTLNPLDAQAQAEANANPLAFAADVNHNQNITSHLDIHPPSALGPNNPAAANEQVDETRFNTVLQTHLTRIENTLRPFIEANLTEALQYIAQNRGIEYLENILPSGEGHAEGDAHGGFIADGILLMYAEFSHPADTTFRVLRQHFRALGVWRD